MNVLFCNFPWMQHYIGITDDDKPTNAGYVVKEVGDKSESYNFLDVNGYCYGVVRSYNNIDLNQHFTQVKPNQSQVNDVLVIWIATDKNLETRVVGWYEHATVYKKEQKDILFSEPHNSISYRIKAKAENCYLIPEGQRRFKINRMMATGTGLFKGKSNIWHADSRYDQDTLVPSVLDYIDTYNGRYDNVVYTDELLNQVLDIDEEDDYSLYYDELISVGNMYYLNGTCDNHRDYIEALKYYNTARTIKETSELLYYIGITLIDLKCYDKAIPYIEKTIKRDGERIATIDKLIYIYDHLADRDKTLYYCQKALSLIGNDKKQLDYRQSLYRIMYNIYISQGKQDKADEIEDRFSLYTR